MVLTKESKNIIDLNDNQVNELEWKEIVSLESYKFIVGQPIRICIQNVTSNILQLHLFANSVGDQNFIHIQTHKVSLSLDSTSFIFYLGDTSGRKLCSTTRIEKCWGYGILDIVKSD
jgi:hypothetical protein